MFPRSMREIHLTTWIRKNTKDQINTSGPINPGSSAQALMPEGKDPAFRTIFARVLVQRIE
jgi:hypothetical protein